MPKLPQARELIAISIDGGDPARAPTASDVRRILDVARPTQFDPSWAYAPWCSGTLTTTETLRFQLFYGGRGTLVDEAGARLDFTFELERAP